MNDYKKTFIDFTLKNGILKFGNFTLKSERKSPYYFNTGICSDGLSLNALTTYYVEAVIKNNIEFDFIFGPAYKGIPLSTSISLHLLNEHKINKPYSFNRKEIKNHGDGGEVVGHKEGGKALIVDDVISSGSSITESIELLKKHNSICQNIIVAFDRMEIGNKDRASKEIEEQGVNVFSIIRLDDLEEYLGQNKSLSHYLDSMKEYIGKYKR